MMDIVARSLAYKARNDSYRRGATLAARSLFEPPKFEKYAGNPIFVRDDSEWLASLGWSLYWPWVIHVEPILGAAALDRFYLYYSSNHSPDTGGIGLATAPHPLGPWTDHGLVYVDTVAGRQTETPCVIWNEDTGLFHLYYHNSGIGRSQETCLATSADGRTNWTRYGSVISVPDVEFPGDGHTGYARVYRVGKLWVAHHLMGGGDAAHFGVSYSYDGITWFTDPRPLSATADVTEDPIRRRVEFSGTEPFLYRGQLWATWVTSPRTSATAQDGKKIYVGPFHGPLRPPSALYLAVDAGQPGEWDAETVQWPHVIAYEGMLYLFYESKGLDGAGAFGVAIAHEWE